MEGINESSLTIPIKKTPFQVYIRIRPLIEKEKLIPSKTNKYKQDAIVKSNDNEVLNC